MDLSGLSLTELRRLQSRIEAEIRRRSDTARKDLLKRMQKLAAEHGMSLADVIGQDADKAAPPAVKKTLAKAPAQPARKAPKAASVIKFRHPENATIGWTGHGRKPQWVIDWLAQGKALDALRAPSEAAA